MNIISPINTLGYGVAGLNITKHLNKHRAVSLWPIGQPQVTTQEDADLVSSCINNAQLFEREDPCLRIWHQHDMSQFVGRGEHIGFPIFELDEFAPQERHHLNSVDRLFVCSEWAKEVCTTNNIKPAVDVVPLGVDSQLFKPCEPSTNEKTIFFNCGKWEIRKGHDILYKIFNKAFDTNDNVELWMMTSNPFMTPEEDQQWKKLYLDSKLGDKIRFIDRVNTHQEVYNIMAKTDCGIFPSRAEGWNLELLEMMSCNKPVIATKCSAHSSFCNSKNSYLVEAPEKELAYDGKWFHGRIGNWAKMQTKQIDEFAECMRAVYKNKDRSNQNGVETAKKFSWENSANTIRGILYGRE